MVTNCVNVTAVFAVVAEHSGRPTGVLWEAWLCGYDFPQRPQQIGDAEGRVGRRFPGLLHAGAQRGLVQRKLRSVP